MRDDDDDNGYCVDAWGIVCPELQAAILQREGTLIFDSPEDAIGALCDAGGWSPDIIKRERRSREILLRLSPGAPPFARLEEEEFFSEPYLEPSDDWSA